MMLRRMIIMITCSFFVFISTNVISQAYSLEKISIERNIDKIDISVNITPIMNSKYNYTFSTSNQGQIYYIMHLLASMSLTDDGKIINGADIAIVNIKITKNDGSLDKMGFVSGRFYDVNNKQFAVGKRDYNHFLDIIHALKTETLILPDKVTYEPSEWAKADIEKAISDDLVPRWNQINYDGYITRVEVCQLIYNLLDKMGYTNNSSELILFSDTTDISVTHLRSLNVINGKSDTEFCPYDYITREEFSRILSKTYKIVSKDESSASTILPYKDKAQISDWAVDSVGAVTSLGLMQGDENGNFNPKDNITKEQVIVTLLNLSNLH